MMTKEAFKKTILDILPATITLSGGLAAVLGAILAIVGLFLSPPLGSILLLTGIPVTLGGAAVAIGGGLWMKKVMADDKKREQAQNKESTTAINAQPDEYQPPQPNNQTRGPTKPLDIQQKQQPDEDQSLKTFVNGNGSTTFKQLKSSTTSSTQAVPTNGNTNHSPQ